MSRPRSTAWTRVAKLSSVSTILAACLETSEPLPMATPMSACLSAAASLTASPVIATTSPDCCMSLARRSLSSGATRPNTCSRGSRSTTSASDRCCSSVPVITPGPRPSSSAIARAVTVWSPVIIRTSTPAPSAAWTASLASVRSGSTIPTRATKTRSVTAAIGSASAADIAASSMSLAANASTRSPRSDSWRLAARSSSRTVPIGTCWPCHRARSQWSRTTSGAPLTVTRCGCWTIGPASQSGRSWKVAMNLYSESNGTSARRGSVCRVCSASTPIFAASTTNAASVGSPMTDPSSPTVASVHSTRVPPSLSLPDGSPRPVRSWLCADGRPGSAGRLPQSCPQDVDAEQQDPRGEQQLHPGSQAHADQQDDGDGESEHPDPSRNHLCPERNGSRAHGEHRGHPHRIHVQQEPGDLAADRQRIRAESCRRSGRRLRDQPAGKGASDEQQGHEQQAAAEEHRREEPVLPLPYPVSHDPDEPQEGDAGERHQVQRDDDGGAAPRICQPCTGLGRIGRYRDGDEDEDQAEQQREKDSRDGRGTGRTKPGARYRWLVIHDSNGPP